MYELHFPEKHQDLRPPNISRKTDLMCFIKTYRRYHGYIEIFISWYDNDRKHKFRLELSINLTKSYIR